MLNTALTRRRAIVAGVRQPNAGGIFALMRGLQRRADAASATLGASGHLGSRWRRQTTFRAAIRDETAREKVVCSRGEWAVASG